MNAINRILIFLILSTSLTLSQEDGRLLGIVIHAETGDSLKGATISIVGTPLSTTSNAKGAYLLTNVSKGIHTVIFSCAGFKADTMRNVQVNGSGYNRLDARLYPATRSEMAGEAEKTQLVTLDPHLIDVGLQRINPNAVGRIAGTFDDIHRTVNLLSGVQSAGDYTGMYSVRGGSPGQNRLFLDGLALPNPYRLRLLLGGGFSVLNTTALRDAQLYTTHFPGQYGDFLSSAFSLQSRNGRRDRFGAGGSIDLVQTRALFEGPLPGKKGGWIVSARRSYFDVFADPFVKNQTLPYMFDFDGKLDVDLSQDIKLSYKFLYADEATQIIAETDQDIQVAERGKLNKHMIVLESRFSERAQASLRTAYYDQTFDYSLYANKLDSAAAFQNFDSRVKGLQVLQTFTMTFNENHRLSQGLFFSSETSQLGLESNTVNIGFTRRDLPAPTQFEQRSGNIGAFVDYTARISAQFETTVGLRYDYHELFKKDDVGGKLSLVYRISPDMAARVHWGTVHQSPDVMAGFIRETPLNLQDATDLKSESATHYVLGFDRNWDHNIITRLEIYQKNLSRLLLPQDRITFRPLNSGQGYAQGFDLTFEKTKGTNGRFSALFSYSYGKSEYRDTRDFIWIPFNYDRRHGIRAMADITLSQYWGFNAVWRYNSGLPYNEINGYSWQVYDRSRYVKSTQNKRRYPDYSRFDMRFYFHMPWRKSHLMLYLDIVNLFNQKNIYDRMYYTTDTENQDGTTTKAFKYATIYTIPFFPSLGVSLWY